MDDMRSLCLFLTFTGQIAMKCVQDIHASQKVDIFNDPSLDLLSWLPSYDRILFYSSYKKTEQEDFYDIYRKYLSYPEHETLHFGHSMNFPPERPSEGQDF